MAFLPPGYVFNPTDEILIAYYLKDKAMGLFLTCDRILERKLYGEGPDFAPWIVFSDDDPWGIVGNSLKKEIYVFTKLEKIGERQIVRRAGCGTWTGKARPKNIENCNGEVIGVKKSFTFKVNDNLNQDEIDRKHGHWIMHEYTLERSSLEGVDNTDYAICRISCDPPKCCVKEESWPPIMSEKEFSRYMEENTLNRALNDQELNYENDVSWMTESSHGTQEYYPYGVNFSAPI